MSRIQGASIAALLALVSAIGHADALLVNTTEDEDNLINKSCSLREAVSYVHNKNLILKSLPFVETPIAAKSSRINSLESDKKIFETQLEGTTGAEKTRLENEIKRVDGEVADLKAQVAVLEESKKAILSQVTGLQIYGCTPGAASEADIISLKSDLSPDPAKPNPFQIKLRPITVSDSMTIQRDDSADSTDPTVTEVTPTIQVTGDFRAFNLDDGIADQKSRILVLLRDLTISGCNHAPATPKVCDVNGGVIYNRENLETTGVTIRDGHASGLGGGLYIADYGTVKLLETTFERNRAAEGAALYSLEPGVQVQRSSFIANTSANPGNAVFRVVKGDFTDASGPNGGPFAISSTFSGNAGVAIQVPAELKLLNLTVVLNGAGINFDNLNLDVTNSIIAGNSGNDCVNEGVLTKFRFNLFMNGCPMGLAADKNIQISGVGAETLIADADADGKCDLPPAVGLLCPLSANGGKAEFHLPRLLASYTDILESPIVNKGMAPGDVSSAEGCAPVDQRGVSTVLCDIGAVELVSLNQATQGKDIKSGDSARFSMLEKIGDGELLPSAKCPVAVPANSNYHPEIDGCPTITKSPVRGRLSFDKVTHEVIYTPLDTYHGRDKFSYSVVTTLSRFSNAVNNRTLTMDVTVVAEPDNTFQSKTFGGGAFGWSGLIMLAGLAISRRRVKRG